MDICPAVPPAAGFISSMIGYIDCQAQMLGSGAWTALAAPGSTLSIVLTGFLTIFIALIGYNLLLGHSITVRSGTLAFVKVGAILALATSWPAYRTLVYDLVTDGPAQLVREIGPRAGVPGADGTLAQRLDLTDGALAQLAILGAGNPPAGAAEVPPPPFGGFDAFALGSARIMFELTALAGLGIVRLISGLMLALGPFFIAFLMFDSTRSLFEGWVRVLAGAAVASIGVSIALGLELALIEPWLGNVLARRMGREALPTVPTELFVIVCLFSLVVVAALYACARTMQAFRLAPMVRGKLASADHRTAEAGLAAPAEATRAIAKADRSRAGELAAVLVATSRREQLKLVSGMAAAPGSIERAPSVRRPRDGEPTAARVGRSFSRRPPARTSATAARRDAGA